MWDVLRDVCGAGGCLDGKKFMMARSGGAGGMRCRFVIFDILVGWAATARMRVWSQAACLRRRAMDTP